MKTTNDKKNLKKFGQHLASLREQKGMSLRDLEYASGIDNSKISKIEKGAINITLNTMIDLAEGLEITVKQLVDCSFD